MWKSGIEPGQRFDTGSPSPLLVHYIQNTHFIPHGRALVPGCGRGYDVTALATPHRSVLGLDIVQLAITAAQTRLESLDDRSCYKPNCHFSTTSFFDLKPSTDDEKYDFIYDYTFLCALDPSIRADWARQMAALTKPGGILLTLVYPISPDKVSYASV